MSQWKFEDLEVDIDFTDADFLERLDQAQENLNAESKEIPKVGKSADIIRAECACFNRFFDTLFDDGASDLMFHGKNSLEMHLKAVELFADFGAREDNRIDNQYGKYAVNKGGNRQQKRAYEKSQNNSTARR